MRLIPVRQLVLLGVMVVAGCQNPTGRADTEGRLDPRLMMGNGNGKGGGGGGPGAGEPTPTLVFPTVTTAGLTNAIQGDGRDAGGNALATGDSRYQDGQCAIRVGLGSGTDTLQVSIFIETRLKRKDPCVGGVRDLAVHYPPNPIFSPQESMVSFSWKWEPDTAPNVGDHTISLGKINVRGQGDVCNPMRYNPLKYGATFAASDFIMVERIEGGWRLFTAPAPENVGQCEDDSGIGNEPGVTIPLDFEFLVDEDAGDGIGPAG